MLISFTCPATAYSHNNEPVTTPDVLRSLDGLRDNDVDIADYFSFPLDQLGLIDNGVRFRFDASSATLLATLSFRCIPRLDASLLSKLCDEAAAQLSDGYGEEGFAVASHDRIRSIAYVIERADGAWAIQVEQIDDGAPVPDLRPHPLLRAAEEGALNRVREVIQGLSSGAMPLNRFGVSPLTLAAGQGHAMVVRELLAANFTAVETNAAMTLAAQRGDMKILRLLLDHGAPPDQNRAEVMSGVVGRHDDATPLMWAASRKNLDAANLLVERGADANRQTMHGETPLMYCQSPEIVHFLIAAGADPGVRDAEGKTALDGAKLQFEANSGWEPGRQMWWAVVDALMQYEPQPEG